MAQSTKSPTIPQVNFSFLEDKPTVGDFGGGDISHLGGLPIFALVEQSTNFVRGAAAKVVDIRRQDIVTHSIFNLVWQRVLLILAGLWRRDRDQLDLHELVLANDAARVLAGRAGL